MSAGLSRRPTLGFTLLLGLVMALGPLSIDLYLPAFVQMAREFGASGAQVQYTLSVYLLGLALGQAAYGPVADKYGRRGPLLAGLGLYLAASLLCAVASSVEVLTLARGLQALGGAAGAVITSAVVRDRFSGKAAASLFSTLMLVTGVAPAIAPTLGTWLLTFMSWRLLFVVLAAYAALCWALSLRGLPETHPVAARAGVRLRDTAGIYARLLTQRSFITYALASGFTFGALFAYVSGSPFLFLQTLQASAGLYAVLFGLNSLSLTLASQLNRVLLRTCEPAQVARAAAWVAVGVGSALLACAATHILYLPLLAALFFSLMFCIGALLPNNAAMALSSVSERVGSAAALSGTLQMGLGAVAGALVGALGGSLLAVAGVIFSFTLGTLLCLQLARKSPSAQAGAVG